MADVAPLAPNGSQSLCRFIGMTVVATPIIPGAFVSAGMLFVAKVPLTALGWFLMMVALPVGAIWLWIKSIKPDSGAERYFIDDDVDAMVFMRSDFGLLLQMIALSTAFTLFPIIGVALLLAFSGSVAKGVFIGGFFLMCSCGIIFGIARLLRSVRCLVRDQRLPFLIVSRKGVRSFVPQQHLISWGEIQSVNVRRSRYGTWLQMRGRSSAAAIDLAMLKGRPEAVRDEIERRAVQRAAAGPKQDA